MNKIINAAILTSGGDSPGMNKAIYTLSSELSKKNIIPYVIINGFKGLVENDIRIADIKTLERNSNESGSVIYSSRYMKFSDKDNIEKSISNLKKNNIDCLFIIGGNGTYEGAKLLAKNGIKIICLPATIDNDLNFTEYTIGFDSALNCIDNCIEQIYRTSKSHNNIFLIETMGRGCPDLTTYSALSSNVDYIITLENILEVNDIIEKIKNINKDNIIILVTENIYGYNGKPTLEEICKEIESKINRVVRKYVIGHIQRGAKPTAIDKYNSSRMAIFAVECYLNNKKNIAIGIDGKKNIFTDLLSNDFKKNKIDIEIIKKINNYY